MTDDGGMRTWSHGITLGIALGLALAGACKDDGGTGPVAEDDAPQRVAAAVCDAWASCMCQDFAAFADRFDSDADCRTEIAEGLQDDLDAGNEAMLTYHGACIGLSIDAVARVDCSTLFEVLLDDELIMASEDLQACKLFYGEGEAGDACTEPDGGPGDSCGSDLVCNAGTCAIRESAGAEGEDCEGLGQGDCRDGLVCLDVDGDGQDTCTDLPLAGETCLGTGDLCDIEAYCDQADKTCRALPAAGADCAPFASVLGATCTTGSLCVDDVCELAPAPGEACMGVCQLGASCSNGTCAKDPPLICQIYGSND